jgi:hypothetical protein
MGADGFATGFAASCGAGFAGACAAGFGGSGGSGLTSLCAQAADKNTIAVAASNAVLLI